MGGTYSLWGHVPSVATPLNVTLRILWFVSIRLNFFYLMVPLLSYNRRHFNLHYSDIFKLWQIIKKYPYFSTNPIILATHDAPDYRQLLNLDSCRYQCLLWTAYGCVLFASLSINICMLIRKIP